MQQLINEAPFTAFLIFLNLILLAALIIGPIGQGIYYSTKKHRNVRKALDSFGTAGMFLALVGLFAVEIYPAAYPAPPQEQHVQAAGDLVDPGSETEG